MRKMSSAARFFSFMLIGALIAFVISLISRGRAAPQVVLSDGSFVSSVFLLSAYLLSYVASRGGFDSFSYSFRAIGSAFIGAPVSDYHSYKSQKRRKDPSRELLFSGLLYLFLSLALSIVSLYAL